MPFKDYSDPKVPEGQVAIRDFGGHVTDGDPHELPVGTAIRQVNATSVRPGELRARPGTRVMLFD